MIQAQALLVYQDYQVIAVFHQVRQEFLLVLVQKVLQRAVLLVWQRVMPFLLQELQL